MENDFQKNNNNLAPQTPINNTPSAPFLSKRKMLIIAVFILFLIVDAGLFFVWTKKNKIQPEPKINKYCQNKDEVVRKVADPAELKGLITDILNNKNININGLHVQSNLSDLFVRYIGCKISEEDDEQADEGFYQLGLDFINEPKTNFIRYNLEPELADYDKYTYEYHLNFKRFDKSSPGNETLDNSNKSFEVLLYDFSAPLSQMCPDLSEKCLVSELRKSQIPDSFCENLCPKISEYEQNPDKLTEEMVVNSYKNWDNEDALSDVNNKLLLSFRFLLLYHLGDKELIKKTCDSVSVDLREECLRNARSITDRIDNFRRDLSACDIVPEKITNLICNNL